MSEMVERVARAICTAKLGFLDPDRAWREFEQEARAAIEAMREPTTWMQTVAVADANDEQNFGPHEASECWRIMIDAALMNTPETKNSHVVRTSPKKQAPSTT